MPRRGLEPPWDCSHTLLKRTRLPISPPGLHRLSIHYDDCFNSVNLLSVGGYILWLSYMTKDGAKHTLSLSIPEQIFAVAQTIHSAGFEVYLVGGCVRGLIMNREVSDWDFTTNATPEQIQEFLTIQYMKTPSVLSVLFSTARMILTQLLRLLHTERKQGTVITADLTR